VLEKDPGDLDVAVEGCLVQGRGPESSGPIHRAMVRRPEQEASHFDAIPSRCEVEDWYFARRYAQGG
jgi:hypothetical protein